MIRKYLGSACLITALTVIVSACSQSPSEAQKEPVEAVENSVQNASAVTETVSEPKQDTTLGTSSPEVQEEKKEAIPEKKISKSGGLGDTLKVFEESYGPKTGDGTMVSFKDGYIAPMFFGEKTNNVTLSFESTDTPRHTKDEALQLVSDIIPVDAKEIKRWKVEEGKDAILYSSKSLAEVFGKDEFGSAKPGTFIVLLKYDAQGVYAAIAGTGDKP